MDERHVDLADRFHVHARVLHLTAQLCFAHPVFVAQHVGAPLWSRRLVRFGVRAEGEVHGQAAGLGDLREALQRGRQVGGEGDHRAAHHQVKAVVLGGARRPVDDVAAPRRHVGSPIFRQLGVQLLDHPRRDIHCQHRVALRQQLQAELTSAAAKVEEPAGLAELVLGDVADARSHNAVEAGHNNAHKAFVPGRGLFVPFVLDFFKRLGRCSACLGHG